MPFITRNELPQSLRAAYDKAAKGVKDDETRTNGKNDETKIDSEKEVLIFEQEVELLKQNNKIDVVTYKGVKTCIADIRSEIGCIRSKEATVKFCNEGKKRDVLSHNKRARFEQAFKTKFPLSFLYALTHLIISPCPIDEMGYPIDEFISYEEEKYDVNEHINALW